MLLDESDQIVLQEDSEGKLAILDSRALRLENNQTAAITLWATRFGKPLKDEHISLVLSPSPMKPRLDRVNNIPASGLTFPSTIITDKNGQAIIKVPFSVCIYHL